MSPIRYAVIVIGALAINAALWSGVYSQIANPGAQISGAVTFGHCVTMGPGVGQIQDAGAACAAGTSAANPTATAGPAAVNGVAATFMRSDAAPAVQLGTNAVKGLVQGDTTTITCVAGVCSQVTAAPVGANPTASAGPAAVNGAAATFMRSDAAPAVQLATNAQKGIAQVDGTTITAAAGVITGASTTFGGQSVAPGASAAVQGTGAKVQLSTGVVVSGNCAKFDATGNTVDQGTPCGGATGANPTASAGPTAVNGVAATFMRSDGAPAVQKGSNAQFGIVECDNVTTVCATGVVALKAAGAVLQANPANPSGTASASGVMMGLGSTCAITPVYSTRIKVEFIGNGLDTGGLGTGTIKASFGTGVAPANAAAVTGTQVGNTLAYGSPNSASIPLAFSQGGIISGLTVGTAYWFDLSLVSTGGSNTISVQNLSCNAFEVP